MFQEQVYHCQSKQLWHQLYGLYHDRFHYRYQEIQEEEKEIVVHSVQKRKTQNIVLNVCYALHSFALNIQNPM